MLEEGLDILNEINATIAVVGLLRYLLVSRQSQPERPTPSAL
jgi:hypothetical protein